MSRQSKRRFRMALESLEGRNLQSTLGVAPDEPVGVLVGLLVPAVHKVRESANRPRPSSQQSDPSDLQAYHDDGSLLPAVRPSAVISPSSPDLRANLAPYSYHSIGGFFGQ
jgi:hypothetical protein